MKGKAVKTMSQGTRGKCTGGATLACGNAVTLADDDPCTSGATLVACSSPKHLQTSAATKAASPETNVGHCCGGGTLTVEEGVLVGSPQCDGNTNLSVCDQSGETLLYT